PRSASALSLWRSRRGSVVRSPDRRPLRGILVGEVARALTPFGRLPRLERALRVAVGALVRIHLGHGLLLFHRRRWGGFLRLPSAGVGWGFCVFRPRVALTASRSGLPAATAHRPAASP